MCRDDRRTYVWMPLGKDGALPPGGDDAIRISSTGEELAAVPPIKERNRITMSKAEKNGHSAENNGRGHGTAAPAQAQPPRDDAPPGGAGLGGLIEEAQALKVALRDGYRRSSRLVAALRRQKRQSKLVASTLASLRQLQQIES